ncbi:MAG: hypothetical protein WCB49_08805 [Gammaproteobacteria bacterium]
MGFRNSGIPQTLTLGYDSQGRIASVTYYAAEQKVLSTTPTPIAMPARIPNTTAVI